MINKRTVALAKMANVNERESAQTIHTHLQKRLCLGGYMSHHADEEFGWFFLVENEQFSVTTSEGDRCQ